MSEVVLVSLNGSTAGVQQPSRIYRKFQGAGWELVFTNTGAAAANPVRSFNKAKDTDVIVGVIHGLTGGADNEVLVSPDGGDSWSKRSPTPFLVANDSFINSVAVNDAGSALFMVDSMSNVQKSTDLGLTWTEIVSGGVVSPGSSIWASSGYVWWITASGLKRCTEDGSGVTSITVDMSSWGGSPAPLIFGSHYSTSLIMVNTDTVDPLDARLIRNADTAPIASTIGIPAASGGFLISITPIDDTTLLALAENSLSTALTVYLSTDNGGTWSVVLTKTDWPAIFQQGAQAAADVGIAVDYPNVYFSEDSGATWTSADPVTGAPAGWRFFGIVGAIRAVVVSTDARSWGQVIG